MLAWLSENLATIIICVVLAAIVAAIIVYLVENKKKVSPPAAVTAGIVRWRANATNTQKITNKHLGDGGGKSSSPAF